MSLKFIYKFSALKTEEVEKTETEIRDGQEVKVVKKVKEEVPYQFAILKPGRTLKDEAEIFHAGLMNEYIINRGLMTRQQLIKRYSNDGGSMSEPEKERYATLLSTIMKEEKNLEVIQLNLDSVKEEEKNKRLDECFQNLIKARSELGDIITSHNSLYEHTAEVKAEEKTIFWWALKLAYIEKDNTFVPFFGPGGIEERMAKYDEMEESDDSFNHEAIKRFLWYIGLWYGGHISTEEDFKKVTDEYKTDPKVIAEKVAEKVVEPKV